MSIMFLPRREWLLQICCLSLISCTFSPTDKISNPADEAQEVYSVRDHFNGIDILKIMTKTRNTTACSLENTREIIIEGYIGPDARHAMYRLLESLKPVQATFNYRESIQPIIVSLRSEGGVINDAYEIGKTFRHFGVTTLVESGHRCISSCAIAFLGGKERILEDGGMLLFHAPHYVETDQSGEININCNIEEEEQLALLTYFKRTTDSDTGVKLFKRTIQHCSVKDGWVISSADEANLYGIGTGK